MAEFTQNGDIHGKTFTITNDSPYVNTNVTASLVFGAGLSIKSTTQTKGTFNIGAKTLTIGTMQPNEVVTLTVDFKLTNANNAPFSVTFDVTGTSEDNNLVNNTSTFSLTVDACAPAAGAVADTSSCLCGSVGTNDTKCAKGITEWRINNPSITNGVLRTWDVLTGNYEFAYDNDPATAITFTYDLFCVQGVNEFLIAQNVPVTIRPQITDRKAFNHTTEKLSFADLTLDDVAVLQAQYPDLVISDYCWDVIKNSHGEVTSGHPLLCDSAIDNKTSYQSIADNFLPQSPNIGVVLPEDPETDDLHIVRYPNAVVFYVFNGTTWSRSDFAPRILTGTVTTSVIDKTITLGVINGNDIEIDIANFF